MKHQPLRYCFSHTLLSITSTSEPVEVVNPVYVGMSLWVPYRYNGMFWHWDCNILVIVQVRSYSYTWFSKWSSIQANLLFGSFLALQILLIFKSTPHFHRSVSGSNTTATLHHPWKITWFMFATTPQTINDKTWHFPHICCAIPPAIPDLSEGPHLHGVVNFTCHLSTRHGILLSRAAIVLQRWTKTWIVSSRLHFHKAIVVPSGTLFTM